MDNKVVSIEYPSEEWSKHMAAANYNADKSISNEDRKAKATYMYNRSRDDKGNYTKPTSKELG